MDHVKGKGKSRSGEGEQEKKVPVPVGDDGSFRTEGGTLPLLDEPAHAVGTNIRIIGFLWSSTVRDDPLLCMEPAPLGCHNAPYSLMVKSPSFVLNVLLT